MSIQDLISRLAELDVRVWLEAGDVRVSAPKGVLTPDLTEELRSRKSELEAALKAARSPPIPRREADGPVPLSLAQERIWVFDQMEPQRSTFKVAILLELEGTLDRGALSRSLDEVVRRHQAFRTIFQRGDDWPVQLVSSPAPVEIDVVDLSSLSPSDRAEQERQVIQEAYERPFRLDSDLLLRATLIRRSADAFALLLGTHHIVADGSSLVVLVRDLTELYAGYAGEKDASLPDLPIRFTDYALWEREWLDSGVPDELERFWEEELAGELPVLDLPTDRPRQAVQTYRGGKVSARLDVETRDRLSALAREAGTTLFTVLVAAFEAVLFRHTGQEHLIIGAAVDGRHRPETRDLVGMFVNTVPLRSDLSGNPTFRELLDRVGRTVSEALAHGELPFERIVEVAKPARDASRPPIFQVLFNSFDAEAPSDVTLPGDLRMTLPDAADLAGALGVESKFDLTLYTREDADGIEVLQVYNADLFDEDRMVRMLAHHVRFVEQVARDPDRRVGEVDLVPESERKRAERRHSPSADGSEASHPDRHIVARFREIASRFGDRVAVHGTDSACTYSELDEASDRIARRLTDASDPASARVGIVCDPEPDLFAALLGVLKAGRCFVPLDPVNPPDRLARIVDDAGVETILHDRAHASLASRFSGCSVHLLDETPGAGSDQLPEPPSPDTEAYVLYTSGTTGTPKGIVQSGANLHAHADRYADSVDIGPDDRVSLVSSYGFDAALLDIFGTLLRGASLVPVHLREQGMHGLRNRLRRGEITVYHSTPTIFRALLSVVDEDVYPVVRTVVLGGEPVRHTDVANFRRHFSDTSTFVNLYGASESSTAVQYHVGHGMSISHGSVPIGWPVRGTEVVLLDARGKPNPVCGEIAIRSDQVALGYLGRPDLSARAFAGIPGDPGTRVYRTGDLARRRPDGALVHLGRKDQQIKLRGYRVEPGEITSVLEMHDSVARAVIRVDVNGNHRRLVAYVVGSRSGDVDAEVLRLHLTDRLPSYMVPGRIVVVPELPLTSTGKVDRQRLPEVALEDVRAARETPPRDAVEETLVSIWRDVLGGPPVGVHQDFFELGGNSLQATQVVARIERILGQDLPLREFFADPTIASLGRRLREAEQASDRPRPKPVPRTEDLPVSFSQERMWFIQELDPETTAYNMYGALWLEGALQPELLERAWVEVVERHESLRTRIVARDGVPYQVIGSDEAPKVERFDVSDRPEAEAADEARAIASREAARPFDLASDLPFRILLVRVSEDRWLHVVLMHHAAGDLWSFGILAREAAAHYNAYREGTEPELAPLPIQYVDFAVWQREWLSGERLEAEMAYWRERLDGLKRLSLATDRPRHAARSASGSRYIAEMPPWLVERLEAVAQRLGATPFMVAFAAFNVLLSRYSRMTDIAVGVPIANRTLVEVESLAGTFVNTLVQRNDLSGDPTSAELIRRVRDVAVDAYGHQDLPFEKLVSELKPERDVNRPPLVEVMFNFGNAPLEQHVLDGVTQSLEPLESAQAQFELSVSVRVSHPAGIFVSYRTELFDHATGRRIADHYRSLLEEVTRRLDAPISDLRMLTDEERTTLLETWHETEMEYPDDTSFVEIFEERARRHPDRTALVCGDRDVSYGELDARADEIARALADRGIGARDRVAVLMGRHRDMVASLVGVMKSGAVYVPLDPAYPAGRIRFILEDSEAAAVLTEDEHMDLVADTGARVVRIDEDATPAGRPNPEEGPSGSSAVSGPADGATVTGEDPAYTIYTSGSTGKPKGVVVPHRGLLNFLFSMAERPGLTESDVLAAVTTISFDIAALELFLPLFVGGRVVLLSSAETEDPYRLAERLDASDATALQATPATWRMLVESEWEGRPGLKALSGGEALPQDLARSLVPRVGELWNMYGPTETTIWSTVERIEDPDAPITIGTPIGNTSVYIVNPEGRLCPVGVPGEICIGGDGVALGYHGREELTAERFVPNPFDDEDEGRIYRTGDLGRVRSDGRIEHLGRLDHQVKIRGFRIEPGEVESVLATHPAVSDSVVVARDDRLIAYVVLEAGRDLTVTEIRSFLRKDLPAYMVPAMVVPMARLPLTANGKVNRKALPDPFEQGSVVEREYVAPESEAERLVADVWSELLGVERVGAHDNFFDLGGHSLLAIQAVARIEKRLGQRPDPRKMFFQTLRQIAEDLMVSRGVSA